MRRKAFSLALVFALLFAGTPDASEARVRSTSKCVRGEDGVTLLIQVHVHSALRDVPLGCHWRDPGQKGYSYLNLPEEHVVGLRGAVYLGNIQGARSSVEYYLEISPERGPPLTLGSPDAPLSLRCAPPGTPETETQPAAGSLRWLLIGAGVAASGAGVYLLTRDIPVVTALRVEPGGVTGIEGVTEYRFTAEAEGRGEGTLTYTWDFGDGTSAAASTVTHIYQSSGTFRVTVTVRDGSGEASESTTVDVRSLSGRWVGTAGGRGFVLDLAQHGPSLLGRVHWDDSGQDVTTGSVSEPRRVRLEFEESCSTWDAVVSSDATRMSGGVLGCETGAVEMRRASP